MLGGIEQSPYPRGISPSAVCDTQGRGSTRSQARQILRQPVESLRDHAQNRGAEADQGREKGNEHANHESHGPTETIMYQIDRLSHPSHVTVESACVLLDIYHVGLDNRQLLIQLH